VNSPRKFALLATLYFSQGLPYGFFVSALPTLLRQQEVSLAQIGLANLLALPWALKFAWAPLVDRFGSAKLGFRRSWILPLQALAIATIVLMGHLDPQTGLKTLLVCVLLTNLIAATQDIATDGLAVELLDQQERGLGNSVQVAGYRLGMILGGGVLLWIIPSLGWSWTFWLMAAVLAVVTLPVAFYREEPRAHEEAQIPGWQEFLGLLTRPGMLLWLLLLLLYKSGDAIASGMINPFLVDVGLSSEQVGSLATLGSVASFIGAFVGGWGMSRLGRRRALFVFGVLQALAVGGYFLAALLPRPTLLPLALLSFVEHFTGTMATVGLFTMMMDVCRKTTAGSDYTLQASVVVVAQLGARSLSGYSAELFGHAGNFALSATLSLLGALVAAALLRSKVFRERLLEPTGSSW
jgi:MFS family permease